MPGNAKWSVLLVLAGAQFLMVLDSTVMNVSISQLVEDLDTDVTTVQAAITLYALVMAALMLVGGKMGDIIGRRRAFTVGSVIYGVGSGVTSIAPNVAVLILGWSIIEGIGAALILPALAALTAGNYTGRDRAFAYATLGGIAGLAAAAGPMIGGAATTYLSWRVVFAGEVVVVIAIVATVRLIADVPAEEGAKLDVVGAILSATGLAAMVFGVLQASQWGWILPKNPPVAPLGLSLTPFMVVGGLATLGFAYIWLERQQRQGKPTLVSPRLFGIAPLIAGLSMNTVQNLITAGVLFTVPLFLQVVLGYDALETGIALLPLSVALMATALAGPRLATMWSPRGIVRIGMIVLLVGSLVMLAAVELQLETVQFGIALAFVGAGIGLLASQLGNVIQSSVDAKARSEAGGLQYTATNLGSSMGTALIGAILLTGLLVSTNTYVAHDPRISDEVRQDVGVAIQGGVPFIPSDDVRRALVDAGVPAPEADAIAEGYEESQVDALRVALAAVAGLTVLGFWFTRALPTERIGEGEEDRSR
jgi:MFS family permease